MTSKRSWKLQEFVGHGSMVTCASLGHKSGRVMATGGEDGKVNMWHIGSPNCIMSLSPLSSAAEVVHFSSCEEFICAGSRSGALRLWDLAASKVLRQWPGHKAAVRSLDFHAYGEFIASCSDDHNVRMWDIRRKGCIFTYKGHEDRVNAVEISPDGRWISSVSDDNTCKIWSISAGKLLHELKDHSAPLNCLQFHPNEIFLATGSMDRTSIVYDMEQVKVVSRSPLEASPVQHVLFDDSGKWFYTASQDCCKIYSWDPSCVRLDTELVKWGRPSDIVISADQLMGCSFNQNIVSVHIIDTKQLRKTPSNDDDKTFQEAPKLKMPPTNQPTHFTTRPHTSCGVTSNITPSIPKEIHPNERSQATVKIFDPEEKTKIFKPTATLQRSPAKEKEDKVEESIQAKEETKKPSAFPTSKVTKSSPELRSGQPSKNSLEVNHRDPIAARNNERPKKEQANGPSEVKEKPSADKLAKEFASLNTKNSPDWASAGVGRTRNWHDKNQIPTRDQNIPEKPGILESNFVQQPQPSQQTTSSTNRPAFGMSSVVPIERQDPIGLDMNAFLPAKRDTTPSSNGMKNDMDAILNIKKGLESMRIVLTNRHKNLEIVRALWTSGDIMTSINTAVKMEDQALIVDLLNVLTLKPALWSLDLCVVMLPQIKTLITSKYETYTSVGCNSLKLVLKNFAQVIRSNLKTPPNVVDISREERHKKCKNCYVELSQVKSILESKQQTSGKVGSQFRELKILIGTLE